jgi:hypothetical protein
MAFRATATGANIYQIDGYRIFEFEDDGELVVTQGGDCQYLIVAGGGAGGGVDIDTSVSPNREGYGGGGGGGGVIEETSGSLSAGTYAITVGAGGVPSAGDVGGDGGNSEIAGVDEAIGGGGGGGPVPGYGNAGGSGGGASNRVDESPIAGGGAGTSGQGNDGGNSFLSATWLGAGGGGAGGPGGDASETFASFAGDGGVGYTATLEAVILQTAINGLVFTDVGSGGGGAATGSPFDGGLASGSGGEGQQGFFNAADDGIDGYGGGGGGAIRLETPGAGGSGRVIIVAADWSDRRNLRSLGLRR